MHVLLSFKIFFWYTWYMKRKYSTSSNILYITWLSWANGKSFNFWKHISLNLRDFKLLLAANRNLHENINVILAAIHIFPYFHPHYYFSEWTLQFLQILFQYLGFSFLNGACVTVAAVGWPNLKLTDVCIAGIGP